MTRQQLDEFREFLGNSSVSDNTIRAYMYDLESFLKSEETYFDVDMYSPATLERRKCSMNSFYRFTDEEKKIIFKQFIKSVPYQEDCIENEEVKIILNFLDEEFEKKKTFKTKRRELLKKTAVSLGINQGLRVCEYRNLEFGRKEIEIKNSKGGGFRTIPLTEDTLEVIEKLSKFVGKSTGFVFLKEDGKFICHRTFQLWLADNAKAAGLSGGHYNTHSLRHRFARNYLKATQGRIEQLSLIMGHRSIQTTIMYTRPTRQDIELGMNNASVFNINMYD